MIRRQHPPRKGLSLLEVLTALAIFLFSVVVISQIVDSASRTAIQSQRLTQAALLCESKMAELAAGVLPLQSTGLMPIEEAGEQWSYAVECEPQDWTNVTVDGQSTTGLYVVHMTVLWQSGRPNEELEYSLSRVILDPRIRVPAAEATTTTSTTTTTGQ
jgi:hypothetical protein